MQYIVRHNSCPSLFNIYKDKVFALLRPWRVSLRDGIVIDDDYLVCICRPDGFVLISVMHPAMELCGVQARFTDPDSGEVVCPESVSNQVSDYVMAATHAGLSFDHMSEHTVDHALVAGTPRAAKYLGWPLLLLMKLSAADQADGITD